MSASIEAEKKSINELFSKFWFVIPEYQRSYVWDQDNVSELLDDLWFASVNKNESEYFLGSLVLKKTEETRFAEFEVLDGQQRLTTFFLMLAVIRDLATNSKLKQSCHKKIFQEENEFEGIPERTRIEYKIRDNVDHFIDQFILKEGGTSNLADLKSYEQSKNVSISCMATALRVMHGFLSNLSDDSINEFSKFVSIKPVFIYVSTESREDAFRLFTILNNRGVPLSSADILKSINIGAITEEKERNKYALKWETMEGDFGDEFDRFLSFLRTILVKEKARKNLLEEYEENIYAKNKLEKGTDTINFIEKYKGLYDKAVRLNNLNIDNDYKNLLTIMDIGLPSGDWIPPLLSYYEKYNTASLVEFLKKLEFKFSSDWILQETPTKRIDNMNVIIDIINESESLDNVLNNDEIFKIDIDSLTRVLSSNIYGRRYARYILLKYEYLLSDNTVHLSNYKTISVEHILPQNPKPNSDWISLFTKDERVMWLHKLGNLVLINKRKNARLSNLDFDLKKKKYLSGRIDVFKGSKVFIESHSVWSADEIVKRQNSMLKSLTKLP